jgi:hypothetical protein
MLGSANKKKVDPKTLTPMIYPYTWTAMMIHFPHVYEWKASWMWRYYTYSFVLFLPLWAWITSKGELTMILDVLMLCVLTTSLAVNSKEAKLAWKKKKELDSKKDHLKEWEVL